MIRPIASPTKALLADGFAVVPDVVDPSTVDALALALALAIEAVESLDAALRRDGELYGMRDLLRAIPEVRQLAGSPGLLDLVEPVLGPGAFAVRGLLFDKTAAANWSVPWHQDLTIAVRDRVDAPGFGPWTKKAGIPHVRPPVEVLQGMVTLRVHLDDCEADQGPLRVLPGSHLGGRLSAEVTRDFLERVKAVDCLVPSGGVVMMRPLVLHASSAATEPRRRRVIHLEYAVEALPGGVDWFEAVGRDVA
jgi:Phytanoyl-CoA dioxygenase (PhyH)